MSSENVPLPAPRRALQELTNMTVGTPADAKKRLKLPAGGSRKLGPARKVAASGGVVDEPDDSENVPLQPPPQPAPPASASLLSASSSASLLLPHAQPMQTPTRAVGAHHHLGATAPTPLPSTHAAPVASTPAAMRLRQSAASLLAHSPTHAARRSPAVHSHQPHMSDSPAPAQLAVTPVRGAPVTPAPYHSVASLAAARSNMLLSPLLEDDGSAQPLSSQVPPTPRNLGNLDLSASLATPASTIVLAAAVADAAAAAVADAAAAAAASAPHPASAAATTTAAGPAAAPAKPATIAGEAGKAANPAEPTAATPSEPQRHPQLRGALHPIATASSVPSFAPLDLVSMAPPAGAGSLLSSLASLATSPLRGVEAAPPPQPLQPPPQTQQAPSSVLALPARTPIAPAAPASVSAPVAPAPVPAPASASASAAAAATKKHRTSGSSGGSKVVPHKVNGHLYYQFQVIGRGGSSEVVNVLSKDHQVYALKMIRLDGSNHTADFENEIALLRRLRGEAHVIQLIDHEVNLQESKILVLLESGETDLAQILKDVAAAGPQQANGVLRPALDPSSIRFYWRQILQCVDVCHRHKIIHQDLKPSNFVLVKGRLKLIDFGIAKQVGSNTTSVLQENQVGTLNYMSPEAVTPDDEQGGSKVSRASDVWSLGCILYQMVYGQTPFSHINNPIKKLQAIAKQPIKFPPISEPLLFDVLQRCLERDTSRRPSIEDLLQHPFLEAAPTGRAAIFSMAHLDEVLHQLAVLPPQLDVQRAVSAAATRRALVEALAAQAAEGRPLDVARALASATAAPSSARSSAQAPSA